MAQGRIRTDREFVISGRGIAKSGNAGASMARADEVIE
jgi:hypothetical protein